MFIAGFESILGQQFPAAAAMLTSAFVIAAAVAPVVAA